MIPPETPDVALLANPTVLRPAVVALIVDHYLGLELRSSRLELLVGWLQRRASALGMSPMDLLHDIFISGRPSELASVIALLTNQETSFFRGKRQLSVLDEVVLRPLLDGDVARPIRLWSAACSTGEEALTLAMLISDFTGSTSMPGIHHPPVLIVGSDICKQTISTAEKMRFPLDAEAQLGRRRTDQYFTLDGSALVADKAAMPRIEFHTHNLIEPSRFGRFDVIVARNVFFYMSRRGRDLALQNLRLALRPGGVAVFGANDGISDPAGFEPIAAHCYRWKGEG